MKPPGRSQAVGRVSSGGRASSPQIPGHGLTVEGCEPFGVGGFGTRVRARMASHTPAPDTTGLRRQVVAAAEVSRALR